MATNVTTLVLMLVGSVGVFQTLLNKRVIQCVCLGTVLKLPMTKVTLAEDLSMATMAAAMLIISWPSSPFPSVSSRPPNFCLIEPDERPCIKPVLTIA